MAFNGTAATFLFSALLTSFIPETRGKVDAVWESPWRPEKMTEAARLQLGMF